MSGIYILTLIADQPMRCSAHPRCYIYGIVDISRLGEDALDFGPLQRDS